MASRDTVTREVWGADGGSSMLERKRSVSRDVESDCTGLDLGALLWTLDEKRRNGRLVVNWHIFAGD